MAFFTMLWQAGTLESWLDRLEPLTGKAASAGSSSSQAMQVQVGGGDDVGPALERHAAVGDLDVLGTQALDLKVQRGFGAEKARRHHGIQCRHKDPFVIIRQVKFTKRP